METPANGQHEQLNLEGMASSSAEKPADVLQSDDLAETLRRFFPGVEIVEEDDVLLIRDKS